MGNELTVKKLEEFVKLIKKSNPIPCCNCGEHAEYLIGMQMFCKECIDKGPELSDENKKFLNIIQGLING